MKYQNKRDQPLAETLARRVAQLRDMHNMTVLDLAKACRFPVARIEAIEGGLEVCLSVYDRQVLAKALKVIPAVLLEVEALPEHVRRMRNFIQQNKPNIDDLTDRILDGETNVPCPKCGTTLTSSIETALDYEDRPVSIAKAYCKECLFRI